MHLDSLKLKRFRSCDKVIIKLQPDLTVFVGENNGGKSNIVDALRLLTLPLNGRRERYPEDDDLRRGAASSTFTVEGRFTSLSDTVKGLLISAVPDPVADLAVFGMRYQVKAAGTPRGKASFWAGRFDNAEPEPGATELIRHVFLPPLRDARQALGTGSASRIATLLQHFLGAGDEVDLLNHVRRAEAPHRVLNAVNTEIDTALGNLTRGVRLQAASLGFVTENLADIARDLRFRLSDAGVPPEDIRSSGLGYANLLYMAMIVVELARAREADLTIFLVEEPEAHLHPQLQMLVLDFLLNQAKVSAAQQPRVGQPEGRIQVVVTTHSPNLTSWVSPEHLVVVRSVRDNDENPARYHTVAIPVASLGLGEDTLRKVNRYLDVTRSALLFGNRALLVEGIAEAILLPVVAKHLVLRNDVHAWQRFRGTVIVPIDGVDFAPYIEMLLRPCGTSTIANHVAVITDGDPNVPGNRRNDLERLAAEWGAADKLNVFTNAVTLEHELFAAGNAEILRRVFLSFYPQSEDRWARDVDAVQMENRAAAFVELLRDKQTRKGDFAQKLASLIEAGQEFHVPAYFAEAIRAITVP